MRRMLLEYTDIIDKNLRGEVKLRLLLNFIIRWYIVFGGAPSPSVVFPNKEKGDTKYIIYHCIKHLDYFFCFDIFLL